MMKSLLTAFAAVVLLSVGMASCGNEEEDLPYHYVDFTVNGIQLRDTINNACKAGTLPAEGKTITFEAKGNNRQYGYFYGATVISVSTSMGYFYSCDIPDVLVFPHTACDEDWGKVVEVSNNPYKTQVVVLPNTTGDTREIELWFGDGLNYNTFFFLIQPRK